MRRISGLVLALILLSCGSVSAEIVHGNDNSVYGNASKTLTVKHNLSAGSGNNRLVVILISGEQAVHNSSYGCTYNGTSATLARADYNPTTPYQETNVFYILDADLPSSVGTYDVVCAVGENELELHVYVLGFTGVAQSAPEDTGGYGSQSSQTTTVDLTASAGALLIDIAADGTNSDTWSSHGSGQTNTEMDAGMSEQISAVGWKVVAGAGATTLTHTASAGSRREAASGASFAAAAAPAATRRIFLIQ
jgi:hypothetical protein